MITSAALRSGSLSLVNIIFFLGFAGSVVIDYPHSTKAKKIYLVLELGGANTGKATFDLIEGLKDEIEEEGE